MQLHFNLRNPWHAGVANLWTGVVPVPVRHARVRTKTCSGEANLGTKKNRTRTRARVRARARDEYGYGQEYGWIYGEVIFSLFLTLTMLQHVKNIECRMSRECSDRHGFSRRQFDILKAVRLKWEAGRLVCNQKIFLPKYFFGI